MSFPKRDETKLTEEQGLFDKFTVTRNDGSDRPGGKHHGCRYFVLDIDHDPWAFPALMVYSDVCRSTHPYLADDLLRLCGGEFALEQRKPLQEKLRDARDRLDEIERQVRELADWVEEADHPYGSANGDEIRAVLDTPGTYITNNR